MVVLCDKWALWPSETLHNNKWLFCCCDEMLCCYLVCKESLPFGPYLSKEMDFFRQLGTANKSLARCYMSIDTTQHAIFSKDIEEFPDLKVAEQ